MTTNITKQDSMDLGIEVSDMMMIMMMIMMVSLMATVIPAATQTAQVLQAQAYEGIADPRTVHASNILSWIDLVTDYPFSPWISAYFINNGPSAVEVAINYPAKTFILNPNGTITITRSGAEERIKVIFFRATPGLEATVKITGEY